MKISQMYRVALVAWMMLILSSGLDMRRFAQAKSPQGAMLSHPREVAELIEQAAAKAK